MPSRTNLARIPIMLNDYQNINTGQRREWFIDYKKHNLYYIDKNGNVIGLGLELRQLIINTDLYASRIHIIREDKGELAPAIADRRKNSFYFIVTKSSELRKEYVYDKEGNWREPSITDGVSSIVIPGSPDDDTGVEEVVTAHTHENEVITPTRIEVDELWINGVKIIPTYFGVDSPMDDSALWVQPDDYIPEVAPTTVTPPITTGNPSGHNHYGNTLRASVIDAKVVYLRGMRITPVVFSSEPPEDTTVIWVSPDDDSPIPYPGDSAHESPSYVLDNNTTVIVFGGIHDHYEDVLIPEALYVDEIYIKGVKFTPFIYSTNEPADKSVVWISP